MSVIQIIGYVISIIIALIGYIIARVIAKKSGNTEKLQKLDEFLLNAIVVAEETFGAGNGTIKKDSVMTKASLFALQNKIKISNQELSDKIETYLYTTNKVNVDKSNKTPSDEFGNNKTSTDTVTVNTQDTINI